MDITLSGRGQFTLNKGFMEHLGVKPGEQVSIHKMPDGKLEISAKKDKWTVDEAKAYFSHLLGNNTTHLTIDEMNATIAAGYVEAGMKGMK
ncbi:MAG: AbrB/MazE/SpoVT family DNA-binding domain-containing protein [Proteobacteria bacterium]|nr:AbrB/MazE/SpoVT family DNA-binding domain-containing protein [Pseudomonadota bacterium]